MNFKQIFIGLIVLLSIKNIYAEDYPQNKFCNIGDSPVVGTCNSVMSLLEKTSADSQITTILASKDISNIIKTSCNNKKGELQTKIDDINTRLNTAIQKSEQLKITAQSMADKLDPTLNPIFKYMEENNADGSVNTDSLTFKKNEYGPAIDELRENLKNVYDNADISFTLWAR